MKYEINGLIFSSKAQNLNTLSPKHLTMTLSHAVISDMVKTSIKCSGHDGMIYLLTTWFYDILC